MENNFLGPMDKVSPCPVFKFGGTKPYLGKDEPWPTCEECGDKKVFVCQIDISKIPEGARNHIGLHSGLFQFFFCFECGPFENVFADVSIIPQVFTSPLELLLLEYFFGV